MMVAGDSQARIEREVRKRVADILSSAGVPSSQIALHSLYLLPPDFLDAYMALFHRALKVDGDNSTTGDKGRVDADGKALAGIDKAKGTRHSRLAEGLTLGGMAGAKTGKGTRKVWTVADEQALARKDRIDKTLRKITREIRKGLSEDLETERESGGKGQGGGGDMAVRCRGRKCGKFMDPDWVFCPSCGTQNKTKVERGERGEQTRERGEER